MTKSDMATSSRWWDEMRGTLARLFGRVTVQALPQEALTLEPDLRRSDAVSWVCPAPGKGEPEWGLKAQTVAWAAPVAVAGGGDVDRASVSCMVSANAAPHIDEDAVRQADVLLSSGAVIALDTGRGASWIAKLCPVPIEIGPPEVQVADMGLGVVRSYSSPLKLAVASVQKGPERADKRRGIPEIRLPLVRSELAVATRLPLTRRRMAPSTGGNLEHAFEKERKHLAASCGADLEDIALLGSFPHVPLALVQQMAVSEDGSALRLWLRAAGSGGSGAPTALVTVVLGRRRSTGETIRSVIPEVGRGPSTRTPRP